MKDFPDFMKNPLNAIDLKMQTSGNIGYVYDGKDGSQMAFWTSNTDVVSKEDVHPFDEWMVVIQGQYTVIINGNRYVLNPGDEYLIPKDVPHSGESIKGTRAIYAFGGKRAKRINED
jgi:mannose-6-phosphate isomerase-like protein (cupin superfamily)